MSLYRQWEPLLPASALIRGSAMVIAPHPDDEMVGCGGMILAHRDAGKKVHVLVLTDGARGNPTGVGGPEYTALRREETRRAAEIAGGFTAHFLDYPDGGLRDTLAPAEDIARLVEQLRPASLFVPSPYEIHPDHRAASLLTFRALRQVSDPPTVYLFEIGAMMPVNLLVDITPYMLRKEKAMEVYFSQLMHQDIVGKVRALNRSRTVNVDDANVRYAEAYVRLEAQEIEAYLEAVERVLVITDRMTPERPAPDA